MTKLSAITRLVTNLGDFSGFYTGWLLPAAVVGVLVFLYGVATMDMNQIALEVCNEGSNYEVSSPAPLMTNSVMTEANRIRLGK